jgi:hypothetical protein
VSDQDKVAEPEALRAPIVVEDAAPAAASRAPLALERLARVDAVVALQRTSGNQAVGRALQRGASMPAGIAAALGRRPTAPGSDGFVGPDGPQLDETPARPLRAVNAAADDPPVEPPSERDAQLAPDDEPPEEPAGSEPRRRRPRRARPLAGPELLERIRVARERSRAADRRAVELLREARDSRYEPET